MMKRASRLAFLILLSVACTRDQTPSDILVITGGTLIDGTGSAPIEDATIVLRGERILAVGPSRAVDVPKAAKVVDAKGRWVIPGMIDVHVHFWESGRPGAQPTFVADLTSVFPYDEEVQWMKQRIPFTLSRYTCSGVTSAVALGAIGWEYEVEQLGKSLATAPRVVLAGGFIGNCPTQGSNPVFDGETTGFWLADPLEVPGLVTRLRESGVQLLKAGYVPCPGQTVEGFAPTLEALVRESHSQGLRISVHAFELEAAKAALRAGADVLAHTVSDRAIDAEYVELAQKADVINTSSAGIVEGFTRLIRNDIPLSPAEERCGDPEVFEAWHEWTSLERDRRPPVPGWIQEWENTLGIVVGNLRRMHNAGIRIAVGSDAGNIGSLHGASFHTELELLSEAGLTPMDIIIAATRTGAVALGLEQDLGTLEVGKLGDLVVLDDDPLVDVSNLQLVSQLVVRGTVVDIDQLAHLRDRE